MVNGPIDRITVLAMMFFTSIVPSSVLAILGLNQQTFTERVVSIIHRSVMNTLYYGYAVVVSIPRETACLISIITVLILVFKFFKKGRHSTPNSNSHNFNVYNTMQLDSSRNNSTVQSTSGSNMVNKSIKVPDMFREGMDLNSWLIQLEIYLRCFDKSEWVEIAISYIESKVLRRVRNLNDIIQKKVSFDEFKSILVEAFTVKQKELEMNFEMLTQCRQSPRESIVSFGESVSRIVKKIFPNVSDSEDIDRVMQERFAAGLLNQRLRETVRSKMLKMRNIKKDESFKLHDLIDYAECKNSSYETSSQSDGRFVSSESDNIAQPKKPQFQTQTNQNYKPNMGYNKNYVKPSNNGFQQNNLNTSVQPTPKQPQLQTQQQEKVMSVKGVFGRISEPNKLIGGQALFNNTLVDYMCDSGADLTIIDEKTFLLIKRHDPDTVLESSNRKLTSVSGEIKVLGTLRLKRCLIAPEFDLKNTNILVTENVSGYQCLLGRDIIKRIPALKQKLEGIHTILKEYSSVVMKIFKSEMEERKFRANIRRTSKKLNIHSEKSDELKTLIELLNAKPNQTEEKSSINVVSSNVEVVPTASQCIDEIQIKNTLAIQDKKVVEKKISFINDDSIHINSIEMVKEVEMEFEQAKQAIESEFQKICAHSVADLKPEVNYDCAFKIDFKEVNQRPIRCKSRPLPYNLKEKVRLEIDKLLKAGIIRESKSEWCSPIRVVDKPDGSIRLTVDYKELNKVIKDDNYPIPSISDMYNKITESDTFTKADLKSAFHQIPVHKDSIEFTAFICEYGVFEYVSMPMGIKTAPACFQRFIEKTLKKFIDNGTLGVFFDDTIIHSNSKKNGLKFHVDTVTDVLNTLENRRLKLSYEKSVTLSNEIKLLGHMISDHQIKPDPDRSQCVEQRPKPITVNDLQSWLGTSNQYRKFIPMYAELAKPLYDLLCLKNVPKNLRKKSGAVNGKKVLLNWNPQAEESFIKLKETLCSDLVLALPDFSKPFILSTDASEDGYGAVLEQVIDGQLRPIAYFSKNYTPTQKKYSTSEKEMLALVMGIEYFHQCLYGILFTVKTDHLPLTWLPNKKNIQSRLERWFLRLLSIYNFVIEYKPGRENVVPDWLSRPPTDQIDENDYLDNVVAVVSQMFDEEETQNEEDEVESSASDQNENAISIANNPSSVNINEFQSLND